MWSVGTDYTHYMRFGANKRHRIPYLRIMGTQSNVRGDINVNSFSRSHSGYGRDD